MNDRDNNHRNNPCGSEYQCTDEIVKDILKQGGPASKLYEAQQKSSAGDRKKIRNHRSTRNGAARPLTP